MIKEEKNIYNKSFLTFTIDDKIYAVPVLSLIGVVGNPKIISITDNIESLVGVFYAKNFNIPVFDLRLILNKPNTKIPNKTCALIVRVIFKNEAKLVGFIIDYLYGIYNIQLSEIEKLPVYNENEFVSKIVAKNEKMIMMLELDKIINKWDVISFLNQFWNYENKLRKVN